MNAGAVRLRLQGRSPPVLPRRRDAIEVRSCNGETVDLLQQRRATASPEQADNNNLANATFCPDVNSDRRGGRGAIQKRRAERLSEHAVRGADPRPAAVRAERGRLARAAGPLQRQRAGPGRRDRSHPGRRRRGGHDAVAEPQRAGREGDAACGRGREKSLDRCSSTTSWRSTPTAVDATSCSSAAAATTCCARAWIRTASSTSSTRAHDRRRRSACRPATCRPASS